VTAAEAAGAILGTENLALIWTRTQKDIWYLAAPAADLASHPNSLSALAAALPGASGHGGDGAYVCDLDHGLRAVVAKRDGALHSFVGTPAMVQRFAELEGAGEPQACTGSGMPGSFRPQLAAGSKRALKLPSPPPAWPPPLLPPSPGAGPRKAPHGKMNCKKHYWRRSRRPGQPARHY